MIDKADTDANDMENAIRSIWNEILGSADIGPDSDFFDLGGDSILALNMLFRVHADLGVELPPGTLFENASLRLFTAAAAEARDIQASERMLQEGQI